MPRPGITARDLREKAMNAFDSSDQEMFMSEALVAGSAEAPHAVTPSMRPAPAGNPDEDFTYDDLD